MGHFGSLAAGESPVKHAWLTISLFKYRDLTLLQTLTLLKITKTNFVVMKLLMGGHKKDSDVNSGFVYYNDNTACDLKFTIVYRFNYQVIHVQRICLIIMIFCLSDATRI